MITKTELRSPLQIIFWLKTFVFFGTPQHFCFFSEDRHMVRHLNVLCRRGPTTGRATPIHCSTWWCFPTLQ